MENLPITNVCLLNAKILDADIPSEFRPINLVVTSPPYNLDIDYDKHEDATMSYPEYLEQVEKWAKKLYGLMADDGRVCINVPFKITPPQDKVSNHPIAADYTAAFQRVGFKFFNSIVWDKGIIPSKTCWGSRESASSPFVRDPAECILIFYKNQWKRIDGDPGHKKSTIGKDFYKWTTNVWKFASEKPSKVGGHPAPFPMELPTRCIQLFSYTGDIVCDPFMGSGTTGDAAVRLGRRFVGIDLSEKYCKFAQERIDGAVLQTTVGDMVLSKETE
jgi:site-specific DNA-methyltransferase (adenine-specific)